MLGNHDTFRDLTSFYRPDYLENKYELYHASEDDLFKYIFLDTSSNELSDIQKNFLENELVTDKKVLLFIHHPVLEVDTAIDRKYPLLNRNEVLEILTESQKEIVIFCGHYHASDVAQSGRITQYLTPGASLQYEKGTEDIIADARVFGYRIIELDGENVRTIEVLNKEGRGFEQHAGPADV